MPVSPSLPPDPGPLVLSASAARTALHPLRRRLLGELTTPDSAAGLAVRLRLPRQRLNYHLKRLAAGGLLAPAGERRRGNCVEQLYVRRAGAWLLDPGALGSLGTSRPPAARGPASSAYLLELLARALAEVAELREAAARSGARAPSLAFEAEAWLGSPEAAYRFAEAVREQLAELVGREGPRRPGSRSYRVVLGVYPASPRAAGRPDIPGQPQFSVT